MNIAVAGTGYVGLSLAVLLSQHNKVTAVDIIPEKVEKLNNWQSPIQDDYIEKFLAEHETRHLDLTATTNAELAYKDADYVIIAAPTNYDPQKNYFDCSAVEAVIELVLKCSDKAIMVIKSTIPVGYTEKVRAKYNTNRIIFSPEFLRESKALYDNLYPSRIIVSCDDNTKEAAKTFAALLVEGAEKKGCIALTSEDYLDIVEFKRNYEDKYYEANYKYVSEGKRIKVYEINCSSSYIKLLTFTSILFALLF